jgi:hypothetical protein
VEVFNVASTVGGEKWLFGEIFGPNRPLERWKPPRLCHAKPFEYWAFFADGITLERVSI